MSREISIERGVTGKLVEDDSYDAQKLKRYPPPPPEAAAIAISNTTCWGVSHNARSASRTSHCNRVLRDAVPSTFQFQKAALWAGTSYTMLGK